jgi:pectate lyase
MSSTLTRLFGQRLRIAAILLGCMVMGLFSMTGTAAVPVIPGATGFGITTPAGRGGTIYRVTNLNDAGTGSLRACIEAKGPRVCVFEVSGVIRWSDTPQVFNPYLTIAGQTAPSPGIMVRGGIRLETGNVLIQHMTFRRGDDRIAYLKAFVLNNWSGVTNSNIVLDHCTFSWGTDETFDIWRDFGDITISNSIIAEGLNDSPASEYSGYGMIAGPVAVGRVSVTNNLFAHNIERSPLTKTGQFVFANNLIYNWVIEASRFQNEVEEQYGGDVVRTKNSIVGNLYIRGPSYEVVRRGVGKPIWFDYTMAATGNQAYLFDNAEVTSTSQSLVPPSDPWTLAAISSPNSRSSLEVRSPPTWPEGFTARPVGQVKDYVLANVGARPADRSARDAKLVSDVKNGTGTFIHCVNPSSYYTGTGWRTENISNCDNGNAGGWPVYAQNSRPLTLPANPSADDDSDGYTNLEEWLHQMAAQVEGQAADVQPEPPKIISVQ